MVPCSTTVIDLRVLFSSLIVDRLASPHLLVETVVGLWIFVCCEV